MPRIMAPRGPVNSAGGGGEAGAGALIDPAAAIAKHAHDFFGNPAGFLSPVALRPRLATGVALVRDGRFGSAAANRHADGTEGHGGIVLSAW